MKKVVVDEKKIDEVLSRSVEEIIIKEDLKKELLSGRRLRIKLGIDPTSPNIHIGRAIVLWKLRAFQDLGHKAVFIVGDFTGIIGDTSDKDAERPMLTEKEIKSNLKTYFNQAFKILDKKNTEAHFNSKWLKKLGLNEIGRMTDLFGLHEFEARENIAKRMSAGKRVSMRELLYPLMQGYDSVAIKADVELGGKDQKFNLLAGRDIQKLYGQRSQNILMMGLLEGLDGRKMSSSWGNTINIADEPNEIFGKVMSLSDGLLRKYFTCATNLDLERINEFMALPPRDAKLKLGEVMVGMYHGAKVGEKAREEFIKVFSEKKNPENIEVKNIGKESLSLLDLVFESGFASSKSEARRLIEQGAVKINGEKKIDPNSQISLKEEALLQVGPKRFLSIKKIRD